MQYSTAPEHVSGPSRRSVITAAAWGVPVIALATAMPLATASPGLEATSIVVSPEGGVMPQGAFTATVSAWRGGAPATFATGSLVSLTIQSPIAPTVTGLSLESSIPGIASMYTYRTLANVQVFTVQLHQRGTLNLEVYNPENTRIGMALWAA